MCYRPLRLSCRRHMQRRPSAVSELVVVRRLRTSPVRTIVFSLLCLVGVAEVFVGVLWGRLRIYAHEAPFAHALGYPSLSPEQTQAFNHYIDVFKDQWSIVTWFGIATLLLAVLLFRSPRQLAPTPIQPADAQSTNVA